MIYRNCIIFVMDVRVVRVGSRLGRSVLGVKKCGVAPGKDVSLFGRVSFGVTRARCSCAVLVSGGPLG